jgi:hypothetical protein
MLEVAAAPMLIGFHLFSAQTIKKIKYINQPFVQYLQSKKIGLKTSCGGSKDETTIFAFLGFNPDKTHRDSLLRQLHEQLLQIKPDSAEARLLEKAKQTLPFHGIVPPLQLQVRWINAKKKTYSTKTYSMNCALAHADFLRSFTVRAFPEKRIIGLGKVCALDGRNVDHIPAAIKWNNTFLDGCSILSLINISKQAMDQPFQCQATATATETTMMRIILLSEGKAMNITELCDTNTGQWIVAIDKGKAEAFTHLIAGTITKLYENSHILQAKATTLMTSKPPS